MRLSRKDILNCGIVFLLIILAIPGCKFSLNERTRRVVEKNVTLEGKDVGGMTEQEILERLRDEAASFDEAALDAGFDEASWEIRPEKEGKYLDVEKTLDAVMNGSEGENIGYMIERRLPKVTAEELEKGIVQIGSCTTPLLDRSDSRVNNIELASNKINGFKLAPGEEFSFNKIVGKRTEAKGYEEAPIIIKTEEGPEKGYGVGGGICQLSSTLFNAAEEGGLEITEHHLHSKNVGYVPKGEDATVVYGKIDLKFRNNKEYPLMIAVTLKSKNLTVKIIENRNAVQQKG